ncbi:unnamed protein product [Caenorhabditis auriculariae]|uniref:Uncharacterized protein n=1 Tax=Caenorhabditis auriculariae TaxID=2777116 RepID=A0A8S1H3Z2_9PELO|nr:unnamed protein product [Caenorhabditis auriculariae]
MSNERFVVSNKGSLLFYDDDHYEYRMRAYNRDIIKLGSDIISLRCNKPNCVGTAVLIEDGTVVQKCNHSHKPDIGIVKKRQLIIQMKEEKAEGIDTARVIRNVVQRAVDSDSMRYLPSKESLRRIAYNFATTKPEDEIVKKPLSLRLSPENFYQNKNGYIEYVMPSRISPEHGVKFRMKFCQNDDPTKKVVHWRCSHCVHVNGEEKKVTEGNFSHIFNGFSAIEYDGNWVVDPDGLQNHCCGWPSSDHLLQDLRTVGVVQRPRQLFDRIKFRKAYPRWKRDMKSKEGVTDIDLCYSELLPLASEAEENFPCMVCPHSRHRSRMILFTLQSKICCEWVEHLGGDDFLLAIDRTPTLLRFICRSHFSSFRFSRWRFFSGELPKSVGRTGCKAKIEPVFLFQMRRFRRRAILTKEKVKEEPIEEEFQVKQEVPDEDDFRQPSCSFLQEQKVLFEKSMSRQQEMEEEEDDFDEMVEDDSAFDPAYASKQKDFRKLLVNPSRRSTRRKRKSIRLVRSANACRECGSYCEVEYDPKKRGELFLCEDGHRYYRLPRIKSGTITYEYVQA